MKKVVQGLLVLLGIILIFMLITACAPNRSLMRDNPKDNRSMEDEGLNDDISYDDRGKKGDDKYDGMRIESDRYDKKESGSIRDNEKRENGDSDEDKLLEDEKHDRSKFYQKGMASWYGRAFHGRLTASGESFDMNSMTAAHRKLPFGTVVIVNDLDTGRSVKVRINDRGPYRDGRIIDLSFVAAKKLGILKSGKAKVGIRIVKKGSGERYDRRREKYDDVEPVAGDEPDNDIEDSNGESDKDLKDSGDFSVQAGAFYSKKNAMKFRRRLERMVKNPVVVIRDVDMYKVRIERIKSKRMARKYKKLLEDGEISSFIIQGSE